MKYLLDTHAFLWFVLNDPALSATAAALIADPRNEILVSPASYWEISIKVGLGKYTLPVSCESFFDQQIAVNGFEVIHIATSHACAVAALPHHHKDPFDRLIIAQAITENIPTISADAAFDAYPVVRLW